MNHDLEQFLAKFGAEDCREGSRSIGHCGIDTGDWEDYAEVPLAALEKMRAALSAPAVATKEQGLADFDERIKAAIEAVEDNDNRAALAILRTMLDLLERANAE